MKNILVAGGSGFIGSHLCERLVKDSHHVICLDNFYSSSKSNIAHLLKFNNFEILEHDITLPLELEVNQIYNLACPASPVFYQKDPVQTIKTNVLGCINLLDLAKKNNAKIFLASTSEVYGDPEISPQNESYLGKVNFNGPRSCYDEGKRCAETIFFDYLRQHNLKIKIARIFNTYGPKMAYDDGRVVSNFITQAIKNKPITIYGDGSQTRSFCYIDDLIKALILLMDAPDEFRGPVNLGNPEEITILNLSKKIIDMANSSSILKYFNLPQDDPKQRMPDISLAKKTLSWIPHVHINKGLQKTIKYFQQAC